MVEDRTTPEMSRYTVAQAADILGITTGAVRNRLSLGTLRSTKEKGTAYILLPADMSRDAGRDISDTPGDPPRPDHDAQADDLREQVSYLREQLRREQDAHAEARRIIAGLVQRVPAIDPPAQTPPDTPGPPETGADEPGGPTAPVRCPWSADGCTEAMVAEGVRG